MTDPAVDLIQRFVTTTDDLRDPSVVRPSVPEEARAAVVAGERRGLSHLTADGGSTVDIWYGAGHAVFFARGTSRDAPGEGMVVAAPGVEVAFGQLVVGLTGIWPTEPALRSVVIGGMSGISSAFATGALGSALLVAGSQGSSVWTLAVSEGGLVAGVLTEGESTLAPITAFEAWSSLRRAVFP